MVKKIKHEIVVQYSGQDLLTLFYEYWNDSLFLSKITYPEKGESRADRKYTQILVLSNEDIQEGDWCFDVIPDDIGGCIEVVYQKKKGIEFKDSSSEKKIIACSSELKIYVGEEDISHLPIYKYVPRLKKDFILAFVKDYNEWGFTLGGVLLDYKYSGTNEDQLGVPIDYDKLEENYSLVVDKDNCVDATLEDRCVDIIAKPATPNAFMRISIQDQFISEETAKLAKLKGFNIGCRKMHGEFMGYIGLHDFENYNQSNDDKQFSAPTQSLLQRWLREVYKIHVCVQHYTNCPESRMDDDEWDESLGMYGLSVHEPNTQDFKDAYIKEDFETYEEALEVGLLEALKLIVL